MLDRFLSPFAETAYAMLRVVSGLLFAFHGYQKLFGGRRHRPPAARCGSAPSSSSSGAC